jgi:hypothetical protein
VDRGERHARGMDVQLRDARNTGVDGRRKTEFPSPFPKSALARIFIDLPEGTPRPGEFLVSEGVRGIGSVYLIRAVRLVKRRTCKNPLQVGTRRLMLTVARGYSTADIAPWESVWWLRWYKRTCGTPPARPSQRSRHDAVR